MRTIIIENKEGFTIHGVVNHNGRIGQFTVTPDYLDAVYPTVIDAQKRVATLVRDRNKKQENDKRERRTATRR